MIDVLNSRNGSLAYFVHSLLFTSNILIWREGNAGRTGKWTKLFKLLGIESEKCKIHLSSGFTKFWSTIVKPYFVDNDNTKNHFPSIANFLPLAQDLPPDTIFLLVIKIFSMPFTGPF